MITDHILTIFFASEIRYSDINKRLDIQLVDQECLVSSFEWLYTFIQLADLFTIEWTAALSYIAIANAATRQTWIITINAEQPNVRDQKTFDILLDFEFGVQQTTLHHNQLASQFMYNVGQRTLNAQKSASYK